jgi:hypothetical protein
MNQASYDPVDGHAIELLTGDNDEMLGGAR